MFRTYHLLVDRIFYWDYLHKQLRIMHRNHLCNHCKRLHHHMELKYMDMLVASQLEDHHLLAL
jgi:hypothetical protein